MTSPELTTVFETLGYWLLHAVVYGTLLALLTAAGLRLLRRVPPAIHAALWVIVLVKFLVPLGPSAPWSLASVMERATGWLHAGPGPQTGDMHPRPQVVWLADHDTGRAALPTGAPPSPRWPAGMVWCALYLAGVAVVFAVRVAGYRRFQRSCRDLPLADPWVTDMVRSACRKLKVRRVPITRLSEDAHAPFVFGLWRPCLVLSRIHLVRPDELEAVVLHEIAHLRRGDLLIRYVQWFAGTVLFFWPVVAWVNRRLDLAREHACDEWALRYGRLTASQYARCLLQAAHPGPSRRWVYHPAAMAARRGTIERRIDMILDHCATGRRRGMWGLAGGLALTTWAVFALAGASLADPPAEDDTEATPPPRVVIVHPAEGKQVADGPAVVQHKAVKHVKAVAVSAGAPLQVQMKTGEQIGERIKVMLNGGDLAAFAEQYPQADLDGNGSVSRVERGAYVVAVAMSDPAAVLEQFPEADRNEDGRMNPEEAARLLTTGVPHVANLNAELTATSVVIAQTSDDSDPIVNVQTVDSRDPSGWVLENIRHTPSRTQTESYMEIVEQTPLRLFYEVHPEADTDGDGAVSSDEHDAFVQEMVAKHLGEMGVQQDGSRVVILGEDGAAEELAPGSEAQIEVLITNEVGEDGEHITIERRIRIDQAETQPDEM